MLLYLTWHIWQLSTYRVHPGIVLSHSTACRLLTPLDIRLTSPREWNHSSCNCEHMCCIPVEWEIYWGYRLAVRHIQALCWQWLSRAWWTELSKWNSPGTGLREFWVIVFERSTISKHQRTNLIKCFSQRNTMGKPGVVARKIAVDVPVDYFKIDTASKIISNEFQKLSTLQWGREFAHILCT